MEIQISCTDLEQQARGSDDKYDGRDLSPRSKRLMSLLPKPKTITERVRDNLQRVQGQVASGLDQIQKVHSIASSFTRQHFARIPREHVRINPPCIVPQSKMNVRGLMQLFGAIREIFQAFDLNGDKLLDAKELRHALECMVTRAQRPTARA